jgi:hypothetical protein
MALVLPVAVLLTGLMGTPTRPATAADGADVPGCVRWRSEARYRAYGYDHLVTVYNGCEAPAVCTVTTNVNPDPIGVQIAPGKEAEVLTFRGSPAREFQARVRCALEARAGR